ncbi:DUF2989 domain-containing protein [Oceanimonas sp. CHS3-5]|uniref:DUF2989 domain-containing protein n=1 Tax=Oceanimonas sp. CHS3-5 TaxID=3068186 RepID=UPI00273DC69C|nr:DUF2989 domain-containing protein [Oceanimonas sp. CHS3-5]MDP5291508.1 DUF2989 domain-containing protein [Oceanimonas sp. CHS3-5]
MRTKTLLFLLAGTLLLTGCERDRNSGLCSRFPQFCADLHTDSWCTKERERLIEARYQNAEHPGDASRYQVMNSLESYRLCLDPLLDIQYTKRHERKNIKVETIIDIGEELARLEASTASSDYPYLQLWRWQRHGDRAARNAFIEQAARPEMQQPDLQQALAGLLLHRDAAAAERALHRSLELSRNGHRPDANLLATLVDLYIGQKRYEEAWIWANAIKELYGKDTVNWQHMESYVRFSARQKDTMQQQAELLAQQLEEGRYQRYAASN